MLQEMRGPEAISTVAKSSYDWDSFKAEKGLDDELAQATKDGFVCKWGGGVWGCVCPCGFGFGGGGMWM